MSDRLPPLPDDLDLATVIARASTLIDEHAETWRRREPELAAVAAVLLQRAGRALAGDADTPAAEAKAVAPLNLAGLSVAVPVRGTAEEVAAAARSPGRSGPRVVRPAPAEPVRDDRYALTQWGRRLRHKAAAVRWQLERGPLLDDPATRAAAKERDAELSADGEGMWMCQPEHARQLAAEPEAAERLAANYATLAQAVALMVTALDREAAGDETLIGPAMHLLGEAQASLQRAVVDAGRDGFDDTQTHVHGYLREQTELRQVYLEDLRLDHGVDPANVSDLRQRIAGRLEAVEAQGRRGEARRHLLAQVEARVKRYLAAAGRGSDPSTGGKAREALGELWRSVHAAVRVAPGDGPEDGVPPSDATLRATLRPALEKTNLPEVDAELCGGEEVARVAALVLREIDRVLGQQDEAADDDAPKQASATLAEARRLLAGRVMQLVGGEPLEYRRAKLEPALGLAELRWERLAHHQSFESLAGSLARPEVAVVAGMTKFRSHRDGPAARALCKEHGKVYVELPGGYGAEQIAHQLMTQAADNLRALPPTGDVDAPTPEPEAAG